MQIVKPGINIDFIGKRNVAAILSVVMVSLAMLVAVGGSFSDALPFGPRYGVDFAGGTLIQVNVAEGVSQADIRSGLSSIGMSDDSVQSFGTSGTEYLIRVESVSFGADAFFDKAVTELQSRYGEDSWRAFEWAREQSVTMRAVATDPQDIGALQAALGGIEGGQGVTVIESKVEHNAYEISFPGLTDRVKGELGGALGTNEAGEANFQVVRVETVGPTVGAELRRNGLLAIFFSLALILVYVAFRFDLSFAPGAVVALFHDVTITIGVFCLLGREFTLPTIGALLTIVGYSLNDTIVVYDRIRENLRRFPRRDLTEVINISLNETLSRTLLTSITTLIAVGALMTLGGPIIRDFAIALAIGVLIGTYSSIYVASPMILTLQRWLPVDVRDPAAAKKGSGARL
jgi:preprotein translocase subunit SecF